MEDSLIASLFLLNSSGTSTDYCSALDEVERRDSRLPEVICIEDSPLTVSSTGTINGETITPCSSVFEEEEDAPSVEEVFVSANSDALRPPVVHIQDDEVPTSCETSCSVRGDFLQETSSESENVKTFQELDELEPSLQETSINESENVNIFQELSLNEEEPSLQETSSESENVKTFQELDEQEPSTTSSPGTCVRDFTVPCLETITSLKSRYESKYELHLKLRKVAGCKNKFHHRRKLYKYKKDLHQRLDDWEAYLNEQSPNEAYIAVENVVDNEGPPQDFTYVTHNVLHKDIPSHLFDIDYLVGCSCVRICTMDTCECPQNSGGVFAYDRNGHVRVKPGTPIYECNSRCPCGLSCRNRVLQRGRTVKVAIFRTPNGCGWGVKTMELIEKSQLVTEYIGEAITQEEAEKRGKVYDSCGQTYLFDLDFNDGECLYTLDAKKYGNISHFINHSCDPNLDVFSIWVDTLDPNFPRIAFFANRNIKQGEELTFDYQMTLDVGSGASSPRKREHIKCHCGAANCKTYLY